MKNILATWKWSLGVVARSPLVLLALTIVAAAELYLAYRWLYFPTESAIYLMVIGLIWALVLFGVLVGMIAVTAAAANDAAASEARRIEWRSLLRFDRSGWLRVAAFVIVAFLIAAGARSLFEWVNSYSLEVASWLTFNTEKPVAQETADSVLKWIENYFWVVIAGFLLSFLMALIRQGWLAALRAAPRMLARCSWRSPFLTALISTVVFGGAACLLVNWRPTVPAGFLDFAQVLVRNGLALLLLFAGWLFWILALARHSPPADIHPSPDAGAS